MSVGRCMHHALAIAATPRESWAEQIDKLPATCPHQDCGQPRSCRERVAEYLRIQWRMASRRDRRMAVTK